MKRTYSLEELPALLHRLEHEPKSPDELRRRQELLDKAEEIRRRMPPMPVPAEELIRQVREEAIWIEDYRSPA